MKARHEVLFKQLETYRKELLGTVEKVTDEQAEIIPDGFNNNIRWNLGHLYLDQFLWIEALTKVASPTSKQFNQWFGFGTTPANFTDETPSFHELKELLNAQPQEILEKYRNELEKEYPPIDMGMHTIEQVLIRTIFHEGMHLQAINDLKRFI
ncbi:DinB family protein [Niallia sp. HCP3S3_B10]|uniref:DinB family protein n=1 Tax=Niallia sp. HCP3S3_B10 TaxID=3438944 RepID=UPI003F893689